MTLFWWKIFGMDDEDRYTRITLRIPKDLHAQLTAQADRTSKSLNAEIVERLDRTIVGDETVTLMRGNTALLRALADFMLNSKEHPEAWAPMEDTMLKVARVIRDTEGDANLMDAATPAFSEYAMSVVQAVNRVNDVLGEGWAKRLRPAAVEAPALPPTGRSRLLEEADEPKEAPKSADSTRFVLRREGAGPGGPVDPAKGKPRTITVELRKKIKRKT